MKYAWKLKLNDIREFIDTHTLELVCFLAYIFAVITVSLHHEFWYDELQAFQISKDSVYNILFQVPHWEGHPPLWHLILKATSLLGLGVEGTLRLPNLIFIILAVFVLMFKSPFPKVVRLTLPFTFFLFYQYAVINRPYSLMVLELFLLAFLYKDKNKHPYWYTSVLALTCFTHVYGMFFATVISIVWGLEIKDKQKWIPFLKDFVKDKRFHCMLALLFLCILLVFETFPDPKVIPPYPFRKANLLIRTSYFLTMLPADATIFNILNYYTVEFISGMKTLNLYHIIAMCWGIMINILLYFTFRKKSISRLFYMLYYGFLIFALYVMIWPHHTGIVFLILILCFWCALDDKQNAISFKWWHKFLFGLIILVQGCWGIFDAAGDISENYNVSKAIAKYIQINQLDKYNMTTEFPIMTIYVSDELATGNYRVIKPDDLSKYQTEYFINTNNIFSELLINSYIGHNVFYNYNILHRDKSYMINYAPHPYESREAVSLWKKQGAPDILIVPTVMFENGTEVDKYGKTENIYPIEEVWGESANKSNYVRVKDFNQYMFWKLSFRYGVFSLYMKKDLYEQIKDSLRNK